MGTLFQIHSNVLGHIYGYVSGDLCALSSLMLTCKSVYAQIAPMLLNALCVKIDIDSMQPRYRLQCIELLRRVVCVKNNIYADAVYIAVEQSAKLTEFFGYPISPAHVLSSAIISLELPSCVSKQDLLRVCAYIRMYLPKIATKDPPSIGDHAYVYESEDEYIYESEDEYDSADDMDL